MTASNYFDHLDRPVQLGPKLGSGGEGIVFEIANSPDLAAKVYHKHTPPPAAKLQVMVNLARKDLLKDVVDVAAWPIGTLHPRPRGPVCGFVMEKIKKDFKEIHTLYSPTDRKTKFPDADWRFLVHVAKNSAAAFDAVHRCGVVMGDVNQKNVYVSQKGMILLVDCDSYQIQFNGQTYPESGVGVPEFTPPELQGKSLHGVVRTPNHDRFGLAVLLFHLLFMNRHPFVGYLGHGDMPIGQAIREYRFAYGSAARTYQMAPPPESLPLSAVSSQLVGLFESAFGKGSEQPNARPPASAWHSALVNLLATLRPCPADIGHVYPSHLSCCPWCVLVKQGAPNYFVSVTFFRTQVGKPGPAFDLIAVWARIEQVPRLNTTYVRPAAVWQSGPIPWPATLPRVAPGKPVAPIIPTAPTPPPPIRAPGKPVAPTSIRVPRKPVVPTILTSPPSPPAISVPVPKYQKMDLKRSSIQKLAGGSAIAYLVGFGVLSLWLKLLWVAAVIAFLLFGIWWLVLEWKRRQEENIGNREYEEEIASQREMARQQQEVWERKIAENQEAASRRYKEEVNLWEATVASRRAETMMRYREEVNLWEDANAALNAEAQRRYNHEVKLWENTVAEVQQRYAQETKTWEDTIAAQRGEAKRRRLGLENAKQKLATAEQNWTTTAYRFAGEFDTKKLHLQNSRNFYNELIKGYTADRQELHSRARELQLNQYLQQVFIRDHKIRHIAQTRIATLASWGIETAFDVVEDKVRQVPGFGPKFTQRLVSWRHRQESKFIFNAAKGIPANEQQALDLKYFQARQQIEAVLLAGEQELKAITLRAEKDLATLYEQIKSCTNQLAEANAMLAGIPPGL